MALFALLGVLRGFPAAAYRRTPHRKPLCGLDQDKNCSFLNWTPIVFILDSWMGTSYNFIVGKNGILAKGSRNNNFTFLHLSFSPSLADTSIAKSAK
jgi:hypothetical protein